MIIFIICLALGVSLRKVFTCFVTGKRGEEHRGAGLCFPGGQNY